MPTKSVRFVEPAKSRFNCALLRTSLRLVKANSVALMGLGVVGSKLRKREESSPTGGVIQEAQATVPAPVLPVSHPNPGQPHPNQLPFLWTVHSSHYDLCNSSRDTLVTSIPCEEVSECKGFRKNLGGKWKRLLKKKQHQEVYTIPPELRPQLKQIYVY